jgi:hypothetical protein
MKTIAKEEEEEVAKKSHLLRGAFKLVLLLVEFLRLEMDAIRILIQYWLSN